MARIFGVVLPDDKRVVYALTNLYGIGWVRSRNVLHDTQISQDTKVKDLSEDQLKKITVYIEKHFKVEGRLREDINENVKRLQQNGMYRGVRHARGLPSRGQRTRSNARTKRGKRKTVGALKKEDWAKLEQTQAKSTK